MGADPERQPFDRRLRRAVLLVAELDLALLTMGLFTVWTASSRPDLVLGPVIVALNAGAAGKVRETAAKERLAAKAPAGEEIE